MNKYKSNILLALFIAIIGVMSFIPFLGYITTGGISITTLHIPLIVGAVALGKNRGAILGLAFGLFNLIVAFTSGLPEAVIFINPLVSVLPRVLAGYLIGLIYEYISKYEEKFGVKGSFILYYIISFVFIVLFYLYLGIIGIVISALIATAIYFILKKYVGKFKFSVIFISIIGTLTHTVLVLLALGIFGAGSLLSVGDNVIAIFQTILLVNVVFEIALSVIITPVVLKSLEKARFI